MSNARLIKTIPKRRLRLISGSGSTPPAVGDFGETDQGFPDPFFGRPMVLTYFKTDGGASEWEASAYESELEPIDPATNQTLQRTGAAKGRSLFARLFGRGPG